MTFDLILLNNIEKYDNLRQDRFNLLMKDYITENDNNELSIINNEIDNISNYFNSLDMIDDVVKNHEWVFLFDKFDSIIRRRSNQRYNEYSKLLYYLSSNQLNSEKNRNKEDFSNYSKLQLVEKAIEELEEVRNEILNNGTKKRTLEEIGDVSAYLAGLASLII